jgi:hypothetical protein
MQSIENKEWLTITETLTYLRLKSRTTLYKIMYKYNILHNRLSGRVLINTNDLKLKMNDNNHRLGIL